MLVFSRLAARFFQRFAPTADDERNLVQSLAEKSKDDLDLVNLGSNFQWIKSSSGPSNSKTRSVGTNTGAEWQKKSAMRPPDGLSLRGTDRRRNIYRMPQIRRASQKIPLRAAS